MRATLGVLVVLAVPTLAGAQSTPPPPAGAGQAPWAPPPPPPGGDEAPPQAAPPQGPAGYGAMYGTPPGYGAPPYMFTPGRTVMPYRGGPVPAGATVETRPQTWMLITGAIAFGIGYLATIGEAVSPVEGVDGVGFIPVVGPFVMMGDTLRYDRGAMLMTGILQASGVGLFALGYLVPRRVLVWDIGPDGRPLRAALVPGAPGAPVGLSLVGTTF